MCIVLRNAQNWICQLCAYCRSFYTCTTLDLSNLQQRCCGRHWCACATGPGVQGPQHPVPPDTPHRGVWPLWTSPGIPSAALTPGWRWQAPPPHLHTPAAAATPAVQNTKKGVYLTRNKCYFNLQTKSLSSGAFLCVYACVPACCASCPWGWSAHESWRQRFHVEQPSWTAAVLQPGHCCWLSARGNQTKYFAI